MPVYCVGIPPAIARVSLSRACKGNRRELIAYVGVVALCSLRSRPSDPWRSGEPPSFTMIQYQLT